MLKSGEQSRCRACGLIFASVEAFDEHRSGTYEPPARRCLSSAELLKAGMVYQGGQWSMPAGRLVGAKSS